MLTFEWDANKARTNLSKHGMSFEEASTVFADARSLTIPDPLHSKAEDRFISLGTSHRGKLLVVVHTEEATISASLARALRAGVNERLIKKRHEKNNEMSAEYDFSSGVRGKHARRYAEGANVVVLEPDVAKVFTNSKAVNALLRRIIRENASTR